MLLESSGLLNMSFTDILDILVIALIIYSVFKWIRGTSAMNIFIAVLVLLIVKVVADALSMKMLSGLMSTVIDVGVIALIIIFNPEIRHFLIKFGSKNRLSGRSRAALNKLLGIQEIEIDNQALIEITEACRNMSESKTGALIIILHKDSLTHIIETGDRIDADIHRRLLMNLFFKNSPLHDGAIIIGQNKIIAARCTLPITERTDIPARFGMRHKAAIGMSEESDADAIVVSEETGSITIARAGVAHEMRNADEIKKFFSMDKDNNAKVDINQSA